MRIFAVTMATLFLLGCAQHMLLQRPTGEIIQCVGTRGERAVSWWKTRESAFKKCVQLAEEAGYKEAAPSILAECMKKVQEEDKYANARDARKRCEQRVDDD